MKYTPRRAGKRWREGAPDYILDCFDDPRTVDRYTVFFGKELANTFGGVLYLAYLGMSSAPEHPQGFSQWGELDAARTAAYRYANGHYRVRWLDLPEDIRRHVIARASAVT